MAQGERLYFRADDDLRERVDAYQRKHEMDSQSDATRQLVAVGLREQESPIIWRLKDEVVDWAGMLAVAAVVVFVAGATTQVYAFESGVVVSGVLLVMAAVLVSTFELVRAVAGVNTVGEYVRALVKREGKV